MPARGPVRPLQPSTVAAVAAVLGSFAALASFGMVGSAIGSMVRDSVGTWTEEGWGAVLWLTLGVASLALGRRAPNALAFWSSWSLASLVAVALYAHSMALALLAASVPFAVALRPAAPALRLAAGGMAILVLMVAGAVATDRWGTYGTAAGLGWALLSATYFVVWASRESSPWGTTLAWALGMAWMALCLGVAVADAVRFHDAQAWVALGTLAAASTLAAAWAWRSVRAEAVTALSTTPA